MNYQRMLGQVANIEWNMSKSRLVAQMNEVGRIQIESLPAILVNPDPLGIYQSGSKSESWALT
jgi:hypothetical protein